MSLRNPNIYIILQAKLKYEYMEYLNMENNGKFSDFVIWRFTKFDKFMLEEIEDRGV